MTGRFSITAGRPVLVAALSAAWLAAAAGPGLAVEPGVARSSTTVGQIPYIFDMVADPAETGAVLLATDGGLYWARPDGIAERVSREENRLWSLSADARSGGRLYARGMADDRQTAGVLLSDDRGRTWRRFSAVGGAPQYLRVIEASKSAPDLVYGVDYKLWRSSDGGRNWISLGRPVRRIIDLAASAIDARRLFAATVSDLHVSEDGGASWKPVGLARCWQPVTAVDTGTDGAVYAFSLCAGLIRGHERSGSWAVVNDRFDGCIIQHLAVDPRNSAQLYAVLGCRRILVSADGGATWREFGSREIWESRCVALAVGRVDTDSRHDILWTAHTARRSGNPVPTWSRNRLDGGIRPG